MLQDEFIRVGAINTRYRAAGDTGSAVVLIHGIACSVQEWERNMAALAQQHRVFAIDLPGFGLTDKPEFDDYSLERLARFVLDFMTAKDLAGAHLCGNSLGGQLALLCAALEPQRVLSTLLLDPAGIQRRGTLLEFRLSTIPLIGELLTYPTKLGTKMLWRKAFHDPAPFVTDELVNRKMLLATQRGAQSAFLKTLRGFVEFRGFRAGPVAALHAALPGIKAPCLVVWGEDDRFVPASHAEVLRQAMPNVEVQIWPQCGHVPQIEHADRFNETALAYWRGLDAP